MCAVVQSDIGSTASSAHANRPSTRVLPWSLRKAAACRDPASRSEKGQREREVRGDGDL
jgi:hypothetical protein